ncbi:MAG: T9SS type A sorting domain-containing protein [Aeriscardovia sp.]|nr:T9SS type A sorting domain-containing protein [Aeriscardovia sp.]
MNAKGGVFDRETSSVNKPFEDSDRVSIHSTSREGFFSVSLPPDLIGSKLIVYNAKGMKILEETISLETTGLDLTAYPRDVYLLSISSENHNYTRKLISK